MKHPLSLAALLVIAMPLASVQAEEAMPTSEPAAPSAPQATSAPATPAASQAPGTVARAAFTSAIEEREPTDNVNNLTTENDKIFYFTEIRDMAGRTVTHRWEHNGQVMAEVPFEIRGNRWRVYSSKTLDPSLTGQWKASVVDANGSTLSANTFSYDKAASGATMPSSPASAPAPATTPGSSQDEEIND